MGQARRRRELFVRPEAALFQTLTGTFILLSGIIRLLIFRYS